MISALAQSHIHSHAKEGVESDLTTMPVRLDALAVYDCCARLRIAPFAGAHTDAKRVVQGCPSLGDGVMGDGVMGHG